MSLHTTETLAASSNVYTWEPPDRVIAARYGLDPADILRYDLNTSPAPPASLQSGLAGTFDPALNEYPDSTYAELAEAAAAYVGVEPLQILVGCGADEVLDIIAKAFLRPGLDSVVPIPTYSMYGVLTVQREARLVAVPRQGADGGFAIDVSAMRSALPGAGVVWLTVPNNPTGAPESRSDIEALLEAGASLDGGGPVFVIDEAYIEFDPGSLVDLIREYPRLVVVRTMSKAFAMPGLRVGYGIAQRDTIERMERFRPPGSVSTVSATIAAAALREPEVARVNAEAIGAEREWFATKLASANLAPYPSVTNFLLCRVGDQPAADALNEHLLRGGIVSRTFGPANPLRGHLRFTVRDRAQNERFLQVLQAWTDGRRA